MTSSIYERLVVFHKVTELFSSTSYPTTNLFFPKVYEIKIALNSWFTRARASDVIRSLSFKICHLKCWKNLIVIGM